MAVVVPPPLPANTSSAVSRDDLLSAQEDTPADLQLEILFKVDARRPAMLLGHLQVHLMTASCQDSSSTCTAKAR
eukprot:3702409-Rhodomonas_salina.2